MEVGGNFWCGNNKIVTLLEGPNKVGGGFNCEGNKITSFEGGPSYIGDNFWCGNNPIFRIYILFPNSKSFMDSQDYDYIRGKNIIKWKFKEALDEVGINIPESITGYKYI
jgi:hypothetical protein